MRYIVKFTALFVVYVLFLSFQLRGEGRKSLVRSNGDLGVCKKLVMTPKRGEDSVVYSQPGGGGQTKVQPYSFFFLLKEEDGSVGSGDFYRVGNGLGKAIGYVKKESVTEWNTLFCLKPFPASGDKVFRVNLPGGNTAEYTSVATGDSASCFVLSADVEDKSVEEQETVYDVLLYSGEARSDKMTKEQQASFKEDFQVSDVPLEIVFVIDTTSSMSPLIEVTKSVARMASSQLTSGDAATQNANVRFGLVQYRDKDGGDAFDANVCCKLTKEYKRFTDALDNLGVNGGGDIPEAVAKAIETSIKKGELGWSEYANRHLVLLGDAPNKDGYGPSLAEVSSMCRPSANSDGQVSMEEVAIQSIVNGDNNEAISQFSDLVSTTNPDGGFFANVVSRDPESAEAREAADKLARYLKSAFEASSALSSGDVTKVMKLAEQNPDNAMVARTWRIVQSNGDPATTPSLFHEGKAAIRNPAGKLVAERKVLVLQDTMKRLGSNLENFATNMEGQDVEDIPDANFILDILQSVLARQISGDTETLRGARLADLIANELPIQTPSLSLSPDDLLRMTNENFKEWTQEVKDAAAVAKALVEKNEWTAGGLDSGDKKSNYAFISIKDLP